MPWTVAQLKWENSLAKYMSIVDGFKKPVKGSGTGTEDDEDELLFSCINRHIGAIHKFLGEVP